MNDPGKRALRVRAANAVDHTRSLALREPRWGSHVEPFADGWMVLAGSGMYINRAMAAGIDDELTAEDLDLLRARSDVVGVTPAIEIAPSTLPESVRRIRAQGFMPDPASDIVVLTRSVDGGIVDAPDDSVIRPVESESDLRCWQETSAAGWAHTGADARRTSDAYAAAAYALANERMVIAFDKLDGRSVGCASMTLRDGVAMVGGMSTVPAERRRGIQAALLRYRINNARGMGCDLVMTTATRGGASHRNLERHGFTARFTIQRFTLPGPVHS